MNYKKTQGKHHSSRGSRSKAKPCRVDETEVFGLSEPRLHRSAAALLNDIGRPESRPFCPDPFQEEAVETIIEQDVVVSAPTGSGKTWIAQQAAARMLSRGRKIWYATPLKALSNSKYEEFGVAFGRDVVGILTGDRKENPDAPLIVGTTEILRNQLYDAMHDGRDIDSDLVILDEAHYLGDPDRGVVWEEVLIYLPGRVRLLLLSATISNAGDLSRWLSETRGTPCAVVESLGRPVPLRILFRTPDGEITPFFQGNRLFHTVAEFAKKDKAKRKFGRTILPDFNALMEAMREFNLLPAIFFLKSRSDCDKAMSSLLPSPISPETGSFLSDLEIELGLFPELQGRDQVKRLIECRAGAHHAGHLPNWRLVVEKMMVKGHLEAIFSTSTVAAGVNFPARTVVVLQSDRFNGQTFVDITATDIHQMTGRAGRRGMDNVGFTLVVPGKYLDIHLIRDLLLSSPEPLQSRIGVNFPMVLNLLLSHDPEGVKKLLGLSFVSFHQNPKRGLKIKTRLIKEFHNHIKLLEDLGYVDGEGVPTYDGKWAAQLRIDHPLIIAELIRDGEFSGLNPSQLAAVIAPFVMDKDKQVSVTREIWSETRALWARFKRMLVKLTPLTQIMVERGFSVPTIMFWPAASVFLWAQESEWSQITEHIHADEGDLAMVILRTADHLRQLLALEDSQPQLAQTAGQALEKILRAPLV
jgi:ATP-dependent RNA helicase HelY